MVSTKSRYEGYVLSLPLDATGHYRGNCPSCRGNKTFTVQRQGTKLAYNCYKTSCDISGGYVKSEATVGELRAHIRPISEPTETTPFTLPEWFLPISASQSGLALLQNYHSIAAVEKDCAAVRYDPKQNRIVFLIRDEDKNITDAVGRSLDQHTKPKWLQYGGSNDIFVCPPLTDNHADDCWNRAIVVEDAFSACAVANYGYGIALRGTSLLQSAIIKLQEFNEIILALDFDASRKAIDMAATVRSLISGSSIRTVILKQDLKYLNTEQVKEVLFR